MRRRGLFISILILSIISIAIAPNSNASGSDIDQTSPRPSTFVPANITITPDHKQYQMTTEPGIDSEYLDIGFLVRCEIPQVLGPNTKCMVSLMVETGMDNVTFLPVIEFTRTYKEKKFNEEVFVGLEQDPLNDRYIYIHGTYYYSNIPGNGDVYTETITIDILPYGSIFIERGEPFSWSIPKGEFTSRTLEFYNTGNTEDRINISIMNIPDGISIKDLPENVLIPRNGKRTIAFDIQYDRDDFTNVQIVVRAESSYEGQNSVDTLNIEIEPLDEDPMDHGVIKYGIIIIISTAIIISAILIIKFKSKKD